MEFELVLGLHSKNTLNFPLGGYLPMVQATAKTNLGLVIDILVLEVSGENFLLARSCLLGILMIKIITLRSRQQVGDKIDLA